MCNGDSYRKLINWACAMSWTPSVTQLFISLKACGNHKAKVTTTGNALITRLGAFIKLQVTSYTPLVQPLSNTNE